MLKLSILELPSTDTETWPFALVISGEGGVGDITPDVAKNMRESLGARAVLVFESRVEIDR